MKKLISSLAAKAVAVVLLVAALVLAAASITATVVLVNEDSYLDNGDGIRNSMLSRVVYDAWGDLQDLMEILARGSDWPGYDSTVSYYAEKYAPENSNLCFRVTDETGEVLFQNREFTDYLPATERNFEYICTTSEDYQEITRTFNSFDEVDSYLARTQENVTSFSYTQDETTGKITVDLTILATQEKEIQLRIAAVKNMQAEDACLRTSKIANKLLRLRDFLVPIAIAALCVAAAMFIFLLCAAGHKAGVEGIHLNWVDKIPLDLYIGMLALLCAVSFALVDSWSYSFWKYAMYIGLAFIWLFLAFSPILSFATRAKAGKWWRNTLIFYVLRFLGHALRWIGHGIRYVYVHLPLIWKTVLICIGVCLLDFIAVMIAPEGIFLLLVEKLALVPLVILAAINLRKLQKGGEAIAQGNMDYCVNTRHMLPAFRQHAENLNSIGCGMQKAVEVQMRSERMKAELITNVSHDIKTPLTSIVNYVDLLKTAGLNSEHAQEYLEVLDRQSTRLKKLTEDLIEASKASTGNIAVHAERTDVNVLVSQAVGEYEERLRARELEPVLALNAQEPYVFADGRLLWRVIDNLLGNACKYSLEHTRVYLQTETQNGRLFLIFKNISKDALNIPAAELMERFVRGDASRNTEGSGLGLSIARSLTELQGGSFAISVDGDLFKAEVSFPLMQQ